MRLVDVCFVFFCTCQNMRDTTIPYDAIEAQHRGVVVVNTSNLATVVSDLNLDLGNLPIDLAETIL